MNDIQTECVVCGGHINAGSHPPVCSDHCRWEFKLECEFNAWAKEQAAKTTKVTNYEKPLSVLPVGGIR